MTPRKPTRATQLGVDDAEYQRMLAEQDGHCALCPNKPKTRRLHAHHDHATMQTVCLLCHRCNRNLPTWVTDEWCYRAAALLRGAPVWDDPHGYARTHAIGYGTRGMSEFEYA